MQEKNILSRALRSVVYFIFSECPKFYNIQYLCILPEPTHMHSMPVYRLGSSHTDLLLLKPRPDSYLPDPHTWVPLIASGRINNYRNTLCTLDGISFRFARILALFGVSHFASCFLKMFLLFEKQFGHIYTTRDGSRLASEISRT